jgi:hypothetical protein
MNLQELKRKYSGQAIPQWELDALEKPAEAPKRGRPPNVEAPAEEGTEE